MRGRSLVIPQDAVVSDSEAENSKALEQIPAYLKVETPLSKEVFHKSGVRNLQEQTQPRAEGSTGLIRPMRSPTEIL